MPASQRSSRSPLSNQEIETRLLALADLLEGHDANRYRVRAYRRAAETVRGLDRPLSEVASQGGVEALDRLPAIGPGIGSAIVEMLDTGRFARLERLQGTSDPELVLRTVPGIGERLAHEVHERLHVDSLESLRLAAHDGRLDRIAGIGPRRCEAIRAYLSQRLPPRVPSSPVPRGSRLVSPRPGVAVLLEVDRRYREDAGFGRLDQVARSRTPSGRVRFIPVGHYEAAGWRCSALYSNTERAVRLGRSRDWVVIHFYDEDHREGHYTVVTERQGPQRNERTVRDREPECAEYHGFAAKAARRYSEGTRELLEKRHPAEVFDSPCELVCDESIALERRIELFERWQRDLEDESRAAEEGMAAGPGPDADFDRARRLVDAR